MPTRPSAAALGVAKSREAASERGAGERGATWRWRLPGDPLAWVIAAAALVVYPLHGFNAALSRDLGIYSYGAQRVVEGLPPYVGIMERTGPLAQLVPALALPVGRLLGIDDVLAMRGLFMLLSVASVVMVYVVGRFLFRSPVLGLVAAAAFLAFGGFIRYATNGPREKTTMVLLVLLMLLALGKRRWAAAAAAASLAVLTWQPAFLVAAVALFVPLLGLPGPERGRAVRGMVVGGAAPLVAIVAYYALHGAVRDFLNGFLLVNLMYTQSNPPEQGWLSVWADAWQGFGLSTLLVPIGLLGLGAAAVVVARRAGRRWMLEPVVIAGVSVLPAIAWTRYDTDGWPDIFVLLPFAAFGVAFLVGWLRGLLPTAKLRALTTAVLVAVFVTYAVSFAVRERSNVLLRQRATVAHVLDQLPDATIMSVLAPQPLVLSGQRNPTRHQTFLNNMDQHIDATWPGGLDAFVGSVREDPPTLIAWGGAYDGTAGGLRSVVEAEYRRVGEAPGWIWYVHESVERDVGVFPSRR